MSYFFWHEWQRRYLVTCFIFFIEWAWYDPNHIVPWERWIKQRLFWSNFKLMLQHQISERRKFYVTLMCNYIFPNLNNQKVSWIWSNYYSWWLTINLKIMKFQRKNNSKLNHLPVNSNCFNWDALFIQGKFMDFCTFGIFNKNLGYILQHIWWC